MPSTTDMKKKFGSFLAPLTIPSRAENDALRRALDGDFSPTSSPDSPYIDRQIISIPAETELKAACKLLVEQTGNAHHNSQEDAIINFESLQRAAQHKDGNSKKTSKSEKGERPEASRSISTSTTDPSQMPKRGSSMPSRADSAPTEVCQVKSLAEESPTEIKQPKNDSQETIKPEPRPQFPARKDSLTNVKHAQLRQPKVITASLPITTILDVNHRSTESESSSSNVSVDGSPMSASTEHNPQFMSTAPTTVSVTPAARPTRKTSTTLSNECRALQEAVTKSERKAAELLREKPPVVIVEETPSVYANVRSKQAEEKSFVGEVKEFVRSRSRSRSRSTNREPGSLRRAASTTVDGLRSGFDSIRRRPSIKRYFSTTTNTANSTRPATAANSSRTDLKLDRELPPLPNLTTFKEAQEKQEKQDKLYKEIFELEAKVPQSVGTEKNNISQSNEEKKSTPPKAMVDAENTIDKKLEAEMKRLKQRTADGIDESRTRRTTVHIVTAQRPKTSGSIVPSAQFTATKDFAPSPVFRPRTSSLKSATAPLAVGTAILLPARPVRKYSLAESDTKESSKDSCFTDNGSASPKRSIEVVKAATLAHKPSRESFRQIDIKSRRNTTTSAPSQSHVPSQPPSRPQSRAALTTAGNKTPSSVRYTIMPHQRTPSQPIFLSRSAASSMVNLPARPATRDVASLPSKSRLPSVSHRSEQPPLPPNFSRKIVEGASRPTTSGGPQDFTKATPVVTALPQLPSKKASGIRRMLSNLSIRRMKSFDGRGNARAVPKSATSIGVA